VLVFPGGFGTLDELFELLTLLQTRKMRKHLPVVMFGKQFWSEVLDLDALIRYGTISAEDVNLMMHTDSVDEAYQFIVSQLAEYSLEERGAIL